MDIEVGDFVRVVTDSWGVVQTGDILRVIEDDDTTCCYFEKEGTVEIWCVRAHPSDFEIVGEKPKGKIEVDTDGNLNLYDAEGTLRVRLSKALDVPLITDPETFEKYKELMEKAHSDQESGFIYRPADFEVPADSVSSLNTLVSRVTSAEGTITAQGEALTSINNSVTQAGGYLTGVGLGVYRPNLEDRKVGKVQMHMVDDGFPNALKEIAKVMSWAAEAKGYKLHDWKNLPNAAEDFPSAAYRHRVEGSIQKAAGVSPLMRVDHESAIVHKAHELFNGLAELELILTGKITQ